MNDSFIAADNHKRTDKYKLHEDTVAAIVSMNEILSRYEQYPEPVTDYPLIFVFGLPRSGTTLAYQILCYSLDIGYINNLSARFWMAPLHGIRLSLSVIGDSRDGSFKSDYGRSVEIAGPHEYSYFWQNMLHMKSENDVKLFGGGSEQVDWQVLYRILMAMSACFGKGMAFRTNFAVNFLEDFASRFKKSIFIYIERDMKDIGISILKARKAYYGDKDTWWATIPEDYDSLVKLPFFKQIAGQVTSLRKTYLRQISRIDNEKILKISYSELVSSPGKFLEYVISKVKMLYGEEVRIINAPPEKFIFNHVMEFRDEDERLVAETIEKSDIL
ncbi:MAG: sulfotransferase [Nitrospirota bacterium]